MLYLIRVADDAAHIDARRAGDVRDELADQSAGARLRDRQRQTERGEPFRNLFHRIFCIQNHPSVLFFSIP